MNNSFTETTPTLPLSNVVEDKLLIDANSRSLGFINTSVIVRSLIVAFCALLTMNIFIIYGYQTGSNINDNRMVYFDTEGNLPTYFNTFILLLSSLILAIIATVKRKSTDRYYLHWSILTAIFLALSIDEALGFHELLMDPLRFMFGLTGILRFAWVIIGIVAVIIFCASYFKFFMHLSYSFRTKFFAAGFLYVLGAIGFEMVGGYLFDHASFGRESLAYMAVMTLEESFEMCAIILFISTLLNYIKIYFPNISLNFK